LAVFRVFLAKGKFEMRSGAMHGGRTNRVISREESPLIYWGTESLILGAAILLCAMGAYRPRSQTGGDDAWPIVVSRVRLKSAQSP
jgi:hypothetical protein